MKRWKGFALAAFRLQSPREFAILTDMGSYRISAARICAVAFTVFVLVLAYSSYIDYCVIVPTYTAMAQIEVSHPLDPQSPDPIRGELEIMSSPDVMSPIVTDLELDKTWAKRFRLPMDAMPMQDALRHMQSLVSLRPVPGTHIIDVSVASVIPKEASDLANAVANRYETVRELGAEQLFREKEHILGGEIAEQTKVVAQKSAATDTIRSQLETAGVHIAPGAAGLIQADLAAQKKSGASAQVDVLAPLRAAEAELDAEQHALDDLQLKLRQEKTDYHLTESPVRIIALADPPEYPSAPNHALDLMIAVIEAASVAVVAPVLVELVIWYLSRLSPPADRSTPLSPPVATSTDY